MKRIPAMALLALASSSPLLLASLAAQAQSAREPPETKADVSRYCEALASRVGAEQAKSATGEIKQLSETLLRRLQDLERSTAVLKDWVARRDAFAKRASDTIVHIYARMAPEAASVQLAAMSDETAASILLLLDAKQSGAIMADMDPARAARLGAVLMAAADKSDSLPRPAPTNPPKMSTPR